MLKYATKIATCVIVFFCATNLAEARLNVKGKLPKVSCTKANVCGVVVNVGKIIFTDDDGYAATIMSNFVLNVFKNPSSIGTNWVVSFDQYNHTEDYPAGFEDVYIRFQDKFGNYLQNDTGVITLDRNRCRELGQQTASGTLDDIFQRGAVFYEITQQTLTADQGACFRLKKLRPHVHPFEPK